MYSVDEKDKVVELKNAPQSSIGAPLPLILSDDRKLLLAYLIEDTATDWDGSYVRIADPSDSSRQIALVDFDHYYAYMFGPPNDEAIRGHPLASRGLHAYAAFQIEHSSWIRQLKRMNSIHPNHKPEMFDRLRHYVFAFHDSTFECVAEGLEFTEYKESLLSVLPEMQNRLWRR